jgi:hypothetical protein
MTNNDRGLVPLRPAPPSFSFDELLKVAELLAASGYFKDATQQAQAIAKILLGLELGIGPASSMKSIHIIDGVPTLSAAAMATLVKRSGRYDYRVRRLDDSACTIAFYEHGQACGESTFTMADAAKANLAGKLVWKTYPRNLLFARAMANGARWYCADVFSGAQVYTPEEVDTDLNEIDENVIIAEVEPPPPAQVEAAAEPEDDEQLVPRFPNAGAFLAAATVELDLSKAQIEEKLGITHWAAITPSQYPELWARLVEAQQ